MTSRFLVPTLAALAAVPAAQAFDIAGDGWDLSIEPRIQTRIEFASATNANDSADYDIWAEANTDDPQAFNFYVRRARLYIKGKSDDGFFFGFTLRNDNIGRADAIDETNDNVEINDMFVGKEFESGDVSHSIQFGYDELGDAGPAAEVDSSSKLLFPNARLSVFLGNKAVGFQYGMQTSMFGLTAALGEAESKDFGLDDEADIYFAARVYTGLTEDMFLGKRMESFLGEESGGLKHQAGVSLEWKELGGDDSAVSIGVDYLAHYDQLTGLAEVYSTSFDQADRDSLSFLVQGGYAIPLDNGNVVEPAARVTFIDNDTDDDNEAGVLDNEGGASGLYVDVGVNYYLDGHSNKLQAGLQSYSPEEGDGDAIAFRLAHQLDF